MSDDNEKMDESGNVSSPDNPAPPKTNGLAIVSLVIGIISVILTLVKLGFLLGMIGLILGIIAYYSIKDSAGAKKGKGLAFSGIACSGVAVGLAFLLTGIFAIKDHTRMCRKHYDLSAKSAGSFAAKAQEKYYEGENKAGRPTYANDLSSLLTIDPHLNDDREITFVFAGASAEGFTFTTSHAKGTGEIFRYGK